MEIKLNLYSTTCCHLCEKAEQLLKALNQQYEFSFTIIEIMDDIELVDLYELKIPVLKRLDRNTEIFWPFTIDDIKDFLNK